MPAPDRNPAARRLRAALALLGAAERHASDPTQPLDTRSNALIEAQRHLDAAFRFTTELSLAGAPVASVARMAERLGEVNRRLPLLASALRGPLSFDGEAA
jgi:hypothetical protein